MKDLGIKSNHKYTTVKYNNGAEHALDSFGTLADAIASAKALHDPAWPIWQGIRVVGKEGVIYFDTRQEGSYYVLCAAADKTPVCRLSGPWPRQKAAAVLEAIKNDYTCAYVVKGTINESGEMTFQPDC